MSDTNLVSRRYVVKSSLFGLLAVSLPKIGFAEEIQTTPSGPSGPEDLFYRYPAIHDEIVSEVVGASHFDLDRVKELVDSRPELARATWDWGFGDWETAIGAASHVGRRDIVSYLLSKGARPDIFTLAMMGESAAVKSCIEAIPGIQKTPGPHGISLLQHAKNGLRGEKSFSNKQRKRQHALIEYLEKLGDADGPKYDRLSESEKEKFLGDYKYGTGEGDGFSIRLNMRKLLSLGKIGTFGGAIFPIGNNRFTYNGTPSVEIQFEVEGTAVRSLTIYEPGLTLKANKV